MGRVRGGNASIIDGRLGVSSDANLWLINPAGILFGHDAQLNLQGDFTAATAHAVGFEQGWFGDGANYSALLGAPQQLAFLAEPAHLVNLGRLEVAAGQHLRLLGGQVINAGSLSAPAGTITLSAVANANRVNLSQAGQVLSLELDAPAPASALTDITPVDLPTLLTGAGTSNEQANTLSVNGDGSIQLTQSTAIVPGAGDALVPRSAECCGRARGPSIGARRSHRVSRRHSSCRWSHPRGANLYWGATTKAMAPCPMQPKLSLIQDRVKCRCSPTRPRWRGDCLG